MRYILAFLVAFPIFSYAQFRIVGNATFTINNDSTYTGVVGGKPDLTGFGYTPLGIQVGDVLFTAVEYAYKVDSVWNQTRTTASIRIQEYNILTDSMTNQSWGKPYGQFLIARLNPNRTIPQAPIAVLASSPQLNAAVDAHNAKVAVTSVSQIIDSTRLNATGDTLFYYQNGSIIGFGNIAAGLWDESDREVGVIYSLDEVAIGTDTTPFGTDLYVYDSTAIANIEIAGNNSVFLRLNEGVNVWDIINQSGSGDVFRIAQAGTFPATGTSFLIDTFDNVGIDATPLQLSSTQSKLFVNGNRVQVYDSGTGGAFYLTNSATGDSGNNGMYMYLSGTDGNLILFEDGQLNIGVNNTTQLAVTDTAIGFFTSTPEFPLTISSTKGALLPKGTTLQRPTYVDNGLLRYNIDSSRFEYYSQAVSNWIQLTDTSGYNISANLTDSTLNIVDGNGVVSVDLRSAFENTDTSGYNIALSYSQDTLYLTDGQSTLKAEVKAGLWLESTKQAGTIYYNDNVAIGTDSVFNNADFYINGGLMQLNNPSTFGSFQMTNSSTGSGGNNGVYLYLNGLDANLTLFEQADLNLGVNNSSQITVTDTAIGMFTTTPEFPLTINSTKGVQLASGTTAQRPTSINDGLLRYNTTDKLFEYYNQSIAGWTQLTDTSGYNLAATFISDTLKITDGNGQVAVNIPTGGTSGYNTTLTYTNDTLYLTDDNSTLKAEILDTSGYNISLTFANDTLYLTDGNGMLKVELPQVADTDDQTLSIVNKDSVAISEGNQVQLPIYYDYNESETYIGLLENDEPMYIGQQTRFRIKNQTGSTIPQGALVGFAGTTGASGNILVSPFLADGNTPARYVLGITTQEMINGADGYAMTFGKLRGITTDSNYVGTEAWAEGDILWADPVNTGGLTKTEPEAPNLKLPVAAVVYAAENTGELVVRVETGFSIFDAGDAQITTPLDNQLLVYDATQERWENGYVRVDSITIFGEGTTANPLRVDSNFCGCTDFIAQYIDTTVLLADPDTITRRISGNRVGGDMTTNYHIIDNELDSCNIDYLDVYISQFVDPYSNGPYSFDIYYQNNETHPDSNMLITSFNGYNDSTVRVDLTNYTLYKPGALYLVTPPTSESLIKGWDKIIVDYVHICGSGTTNTLTFTGGVPKEVLLTSGYRDVSGFTVKAKTIDPAAGGGGYLPPIDNFEEIGEYILTDYPIIVGPQALNTNLTNYSPEYLNVDGRMNIRYNIQGADNSIYLGFDAGRSSIGNADTITNNNSIGIGFRTLGSMNVGSIDNIALGRFSLNALDSGQYNVAMGSFSGNTLYGGDKNIMLGYATGVVQGISNGDKNIFIGDSIRASSGTVNQEIAIGSNIIGAGSNTVTIGNTSNTILKSNKYILNVDQDTTGLDGYVLTYDATTGEIGLEATASSNIWSQSGNYIYTTTDSVGIGTATPSAALEVSGRIALADNGNSVFVGKTAGLNDDNASNNNVAIGRVAMEKNTDGNYNVAVGDAALYLNSSVGQFNVAIGHTAMYNNSGNSNIGIGGGSLYNNTSNTNTAIGVNSMYYNSSGLGNTALGYNSLYQISSGDYNVALGRNAGTLYGAGSNLKTSDESIFIGYNTRASADNSKNEIVIGAYTTGSGDSTVTLGAGTKELISGNYKLNVDQDTTGLDGYALIYNAATGQIELDVAVTESQVDAFVANNGYLTAEVDGSVTNEIQDISTDGSAGNITISSGSTLNLNVNDADASATNELQTISKAGQDITLSNGGGTVRDSILTESQVDAFVANNGYLTSEVDGDVSNEGALSVGAGTTNTSLINSSTTGSASITLQASTNITLLEDSELNTIYISASEVDGSVTNEIQDISTNGNAGNITISSGSTLNLNVNDADASATNEGSLTVQAGGSNDSQIQSNTSGSTNLTIAGGSNVTVTESGNTITIASTAAGAIPVDTFVTIAGTETITGAKTFTNTFTQSGGDANFDSGTLFVDEDENRVGIGTNIPSTPLHIRSSDGNLLALDHTNSTGSPYISFHQDGIRKSFIQHADGNDQLILASEFGDIDFRTSSSGSETSRLIIQDDGDVNIDNSTLYVDASANKVGIGTPIPTDPLTVNGYARFNVSNESQYLLRERGTAGSIVLQNQVSGNGFLTFTTKDADEGDYVGFEFYPYYATMLDNSGAYSRLLFFFDKLNPGSYYMVSHSYLYPKKKLHLGIGLGTNDLVIDTLGNVGIGTNSPSYKLDVVGDINASGEVRNSGVILMSDARYKKDITPLYNANEKLMQFNPVSYYWNDLMLDKMSSSQSKNKESIKYGLVAQEVEAIMPEFVSEGQDGYKAIDYQAIITLLIKSNQEQQSEIDQLKTLITDLTNRIQILENK